MNPLELLGKLYVYGTPALFGFLGVYAVLNGVRPEIVIIAMLLIGACVKLWRSRKNK